MVNLASFWKTEAYGQTVLPDKSVLVGQKLVENAKVPKFKCDIVNTFHKAKYICEYSEFLLQYKLYWPQQSKGLFFILVLSKYVLWMICSCQGFWLCTAKQSFLQYYVEIGFHCWPASGLFCEFKECKWNL